MRRSSPIERKLIERKFLSGHDIIRAGDEKRNSAADHVRVVISDDAARG
jgi:hypothetical protein